MKKQERQVVIEFVPARDARERYERAFAIVLRPIFERKKKELTPNHKKEKKL